MSCNGLLSGKPNNVQISVLDSKYRERISDLMMRFLISILLLITVGCVSPQLSPSGRLVRTMKSDPPSECTEIAQLKGTGGYDDVIGAQNDLRNKAAAAGANCVRLESVSAPINTFWPSSVTGTAFECPLVSP
ncbi:MAG: DUF4156 domain-containing protein [Leptospirales bacterium]|nr:DUF4156 domain-containing protein [Leptospirales bacterium]